MRTASVRNIRSRTPTSEHTPLSILWAQSLVMKALAGISSGHLLLQDGNKIYEFGKKSDPELSALLIVENRLFYRKVVSNGSVGAGESYMRGHWKSPDLVALMRVMALNLPLLEMPDSERTWLQSLLLRFVNRGAGPAPATSAPELDSGFFALFLDPTLTYSAALFQRDSDSLQKAAQNKLWHVCERLQLHADDHLLEIGSGWGSLALHAVRHYGCRVTTITQSSRQFDYIRQRLYEEGLEDRVDVLLQDYSELRGSYDKLVSIEGLASAGERSYGNYFSRCSALLQNDGLMLLQGIIPDQHFDAATGKPEFVQRCIFPGTSLPSTTVLVQHIAQDADMQIIGLEDLTRDYALTLAHWRQNFLHNLREIRAQGFEQEFIRMWDFYLAYCQGGFTERTLHASELLLAKPGFRGPRRIPV